MRSSSKIKPCQIPTELVRKTGGLVHFGLEIADIAEEALVGVVTDIRLELELLFNIDASAVHKVLHIVWLLHLHRGTKRVQIAIGVSVMRLIVPTMGAEVGELKLLLNSDARAVPKGGEYRVAAAQGDCNTRQASVLCVSLCP